MNGSTNNTINDCGLPPEIRSLPGGIKPRNWCHPLKGWSPMIHTRLLLLIGWFEVLKHRVVLGVEGLQLRILGFSGSSHDGVCKSDAV